MQLFEGAERKRINPKAEAINMAKQAIATILWDNNAPGSNTEHTSQFHELISSVITQFAAVIQPEK